jgi:hypothetical protein
MKRISTRFLPSLALLVLAACGGQEAPMDDTNAGGAPAAAAAPSVANASGLSCYLAGATPGEAQQRVSPHTRAGVADIEMQNQGSRFAIAALRAAGTVFDFDGQNDLAFFGKFDGVAEEVDQYLA